MKKALSSLLLVALLSVSLIGCGDGSKSNVANSLTEALSVCGVVVPVSPIWTDTSHGESDDGADVIWAYKNPNEYCEEHIFVKTYTHGQTENFETIEVEIPDFSDYKNLSDKYAFETSRKLENGTTISLYFNDSYDGQRLSNYRALIVGYAPSGEGFTLFFDCDEPDKTAVLTDDVIEKIYNSLEFNLDEAIDWYEIWKNRQASKASSFSSNPIKKRVVYGVDEPLPSYAEITSNPDKYIGDRFVLSEKVTTTDGGYRGSDHKIYIFWDDSRTIGEVAEIVISSSAFTKNVTPNYIFTTTASFTGINDSNFPSFKTSTYSCEPPAEYPSYKK